jgi:hypothetical protein
MNKPKLATIKETVTKIVRSHEFLELENHAMKVMFRALANRPGLRGWEQRLAALLNDPALRAQVHAAYESLYSQIDDAVDQEAVLEVFNKLPATTKPDA